MSLYNKSKDSLEYDKELIQIFICVAAGRSLIVAKPKTEKLATIDGY